MDRIYFAQLVFICLVILSNFLAAIFFYSNPAKRDKKQQIPLMYFMLFFLSNGICFSVFTINIFNFSAVSIFFNNSASIIALFALRHGLMWRSRNTRVHLHKTPILYISIALVAFLNIIAFYYWYDSQLMRTVTLLGSNVVVLLNATKYIPKRPEKPTSSEKAAKIAIYFVLLSLVILLVMLWLVRDPFVYLSLLAVLQTLSILIFMGALLNLLLADSIKLHYQESMTDPMTDLYNRRYFMQQAAVLVKSYQRYKSPTSLIICDIDHFKKVNDKYGHDVGDKVIIEFAKKLNSTIRETDILARFGGEEFVIMMPQTNENNAQLLAERMRDEVAKITVNTEKGMAKCTASFGVTSFTKSEGIDTKLKHADIALYNAKTSGRNQVKLYDYEMSPN